MPSTEYRGYSIRYSENEDEWNCYDVGFSHAKLSRVKAKVDEMHRKLRKKNAFHCLDVSSHGCVSAYEATIVEYIGPIRAKTSSFQHVGDGEVIDHQVAFMSASRGVGDRKSRQKGSLSRLALNSPENLRRIDEAKRLYDEAKKIEEQSQAIMKTLDQPTIDQIAELVTASAHKFEETDQ